MPNFLLDLTAQRVIHNLNGPGFWIAFSEAKPYRDCAHAGCHPFGPETGRDSSSDHLADLILHDDLKNLPAIFLAVLRNNFVEKLTLPLPIHTRDASRRGSVWQSRVKLRTIEQLARKQVESVGPHPECLVPKNDAVGQHCNGRPTHEGFCASEIRSAG